MVIKIYKALWFIVSLMAAGIYFSGLMSEMMLVVFGFLLFGMIFMGMIGILPLTISHPVEVKSSEKVEDSAQAPSVSHAHLA